MSKFWSEKVKALAPYIPGEQPQEKEKWIKLNTNENPYPPAPDVIARLKDNFQLELYPDPTSNRLRQKLAQYHALSVENIFVGNGSDEVLAHAFHAFFVKEKPLLTVDISYSFYPTYAKLYQIDLLQIPLSLTYEVDVEAICKEKGNVGGFILANPNAPTTLALSRKEVEQIVQAHCDVPVIIDEAYVDFGAESVIELTRKYDNLLVVRTFSKSRSLAGIRLGYAVGHADLIEGLVRIKDSFNSYPINQVTSELACVSIDDENYFQARIDDICATRQYLIEQLSLLGFQTLDSKANFIFTTHPHFQANQLFEQLKEQFILVRYFSKERLDNHLRITIGTRSEIETLIAVLRHITTKEVCK